MARKDVIRHELVASQSLASSFNSQPTMVTYLDNMSYQINVTTSNSTGTFKVQGSNDFQIGAPSQNTSNTGNWIDLPLAGPLTNPVVSAANDTILIDLNQLPFNAIRLVYTSTIAGTGTADIWIEGKML